MTIPEWVLILVVGGIGSAIWYGVMALVRSSRTTNENMARMLEHLGQISGRLGIVEILTKTHMETDEREFQIVRDAHKELWYAINRNRP